VKAAASGASPVGAPGKQVVFFTNILTINQIQMLKILLYKLDSMFIETTAI
jgi:hypothetical protein